VLESITIVQAEDDTSASLVIKWIKGRGWFWWFKGTSAVRKDLPEGRCPQDKNEKIAAVAHARSKAAKALEKLALINESRATKMRSYLAMINPERPMVPRNTP